MAWRQPVEGLEVHPNEEHDTLFDSAACVDDHGDGGLWG
jgi:hypothetical protein